MPELKLPGPVRKHIRRKHLSRRTDRQCVAWIRRCVRLHEMRHPVSPGAEHVRRFLSHLAVEEHVAASTQNQAFAALSSSSIGEAVPFQWTGQGSGTHGTEVASFPCVARRR
ncbi:hypothetical protein BH23GEM3_BH23GEM3_19230 [soil metagenome]